MSDVQGHLGSKVNVPNERPYIISYLSIIVTIGLSGIITEM